MNKKYKMILDTPGQRGGSLFSNKVYSLNEEFGNELVKKGKAIHHHLSKFVIIYSPEGKRSVITWSEYLKRKKHRKLVKV